MKISDLTLDNKNANKDAKRGNRAVAHSLAWYGARRSILVDKAGRTIAGNKTISQAEQAGISEVILIPSDGTKVVAVQRTDLDLDDSKARELAVAHNRAGELGVEWDGSVLKELSSDLDLTPSFTDAELRNLLPPDLSGGDDDATSDGIPAEPKTKPGDLYLLGEHRLLCGDSSSATDVDRLLDGTKPHLMITDPPYSVSYDPTWRDNKGGFLGTRAVTQRGKVRPERWSLRLA